MRPRFVLDESSWAGAANAASTGELNDAIEFLLERLEVARTRDERVVKHLYCYDVDIADGVRLDSFLFDWTCAVRQDHNIDHDVVSQLAQFLDRADDFDDAELTDYDAEFNGESRFAPGVVWAHVSCSNGHHVAVLPLPLRDAPTGTVPVTVDDTTLTTFFVVDEPEHVAFFRSVVTLENADKAKFQRLAKSAFPALDWADHIWRGLKHFDHPYIEVRDQLVRCLGGLSDHGAACFHEFRSDPRRLAQVLSVHVGTETSDENGHTKKHTPSRRDRTRRHGGIDKVFWWHVKLRPHVDRIHFLYEPPQAGSTELDKGCIVVGLFKDHCVLPS